MTARIYWFPPQDPDNGADEVIPSVESSRRAHPSNFTTDDEGRLVPTSAESISTLVAMFIRFLDLPARSGGEILRAIHEQHASALHAAIVAEAQARNLL